MVAEANLLTVNATLLFQLLVFIVTAYLLWHWAWGPITAHMTARQTKIDLGVKAAEEAEKRLVAVQSEVQKLLDDARIQAREILSRSHKEAAADAAETAARARQEAEAVIERARGEIVVERNLAIGELRAHVATLVAAAAGQVIAAVIDPQQHERLIEDSLSKVTAN